MNIRLGKLSQEDLTRWRLLHSRIYTAETMNGVGYNRQELEDLYSSKWRMYSEFDATYGVPEGLNYEISLADGIIRQVD